MKRIKDSIIIAACLLLAFVCLAATLVFTIVTLPVLGPGCVWRAWKKTIQDMREKHNNRDATGAAGARIL